ncbi:MAG: hypothetical protein HZLCBSQH_000980 [Candidatus Fervidibacterota bacterium]
MAQENFDPNEVEPLLKHARFVADRIAPKTVRYEALQIPACAFPTPHRCVASTSPTRVGRE